jgi:hypothetical protein
MTFLQEPTNNPNDDEEQYSLGTNLYDEISAHPDVDICHSRLEQFLDKLELEYINMMKKLCEKDTQEIPKCNRILATNLKALSEDHDWSLVQSDKTGQWIPIKINNYIGNMMIHPNRYCNKNYRSRLDKNYKDTNTLVDNIEDLCSDGETEFLRSWIKTRKIPFVRLSIMDHKPVQANGCHPTCLIISAHN